MKYDAVKAEVAAFMEGHVPITATYVVLHLADKHGIDVQPGNWTGYHSQAGLTFSGQVKRALNALAAEGVLDKDLRYTHGRQKEAFFEPAAQAAERRAAKNAALATARERRDALTAAFAAHGIEVFVNVTTEGKVSMALDDADRLLALLGQS
jgi:hypothetical protein